MLSKQHRSTHPEEFNESNPHTPKTFPNSKQQPCTMTSPWINKRTCITPHDTLILNGKLACQEQLALCRERHLCGLSSSVRSSFVLPAAPEPRLINDGQLSGRISHWHTSHTHAALISQWKWSGYTQIQNRRLRSCCWCRKQDCGG